MSNQSIYTYTDGETRSHRGITITRHANHYYYPYLVWYIEVTESLDINMKGQYNKFGHLPQRTVRLYFERLKDAKNYIDQFFADDAAREADYRTAWKATSKEYYAHRIGSLDE